MEVSGALLAFFVELMTAEPFRKKFLVLALEMRSFLGIARRGKCSSRQNHVRDREEEG